MMLTQVFDVNGALFSETGGVYGKVFAVGYEGTVAAFGDAKPMY